MDNCSLFLPHRLTSEVSPNLPRVDLGGRLCTEKIKKSVDKMILKWYHLSMKLLTRNTDYAVRAICYMAKRAEGVISVTELVKALKIPRPFLRKILQLLSREGIVRSYKGVGGGFALGISAKKIYLIDLIRIFQGPLKVNECIFKRRICPNVRVCPLKKKIDAIGQHVESELKAITIGSLIH